jgi:UDP-GlcNAc3NAcA epimerase
MSLRILTVVGARPQFVKASAVSAAILESRAAGQDVTEVLVHSGQHYDPGLSDVFFDQLGVPAPAHHLGVGSGPHGRQTGRMLEALEVVLLDEAPDVVLLYGDTNTTTAGALAAAKLHIPIAHVEAGLRSYRRTMPEEINRVVTDHLSTLLFCPSATSAENLAREGITDGVEVVGDVMFDVLLARLKSLADRPALLDDLGLVPGAFAFATVHRAENTDDPGRLGAIMDGLAGVARAGLPVLLPLHPRTASILTAGPPEGVIAVDPLPYDDTLALLRDARVVLTDSGGLQKEALWSATPCVTLRDETEWTETLACGWNHLVPADADAIVEAALQPRPVGDPPSVYGDGRAAEKIVARLLQLRA